MFATHLELGKLAVLRDKKRSIVVRMPKVFLNDMPIDYVLPSNKMPASEARAHLAELQEIFPEIEIMPYGTRQSVLWAHNPKSNFGKLKTFKYFQNNDGVSLEDIIRWRLNFPFPEVFYEAGEPENNRTYVGGNVIFTGNKALSEVLEESVEVTDIEKIDFKPYSIADLQLTDEQIQAYLAACGIQAEGNRAELLQALEQFRNSRLAERTFSIASAFSSGQNYLIWGFGEGTAHVDTPLGPIELKIVHAESEKELATKLTQIERDSDAGVMVNNNIAYDLEHLAATNSYHPGKDGSAPIRRTKKTGVVRRMGVRGAMVIELLGLAQNAMPQTPNNRLNTIINHVLGLNTKKSKDYGELAALELALEVGSETAKQEFWDYSGADVRLPLTLMETLWKPLVLVSQMLDLEPGVIATISRKEAGVKYWKGQHFKQLNATDRVVYGRAFDDFSLEDKAIEMLLDPKIAELPPIQAGFFQNKRVNVKRKSAGPLKNRRDVVENAYLLHLTPFISAGQPFIASRTHAQTVYQEQQRNDNPAMRLLLSLYLEAFLEVPMWELYKPAFPDSRPTADEERLHDWIYGQRYGIDFGEGRNRGTIRDNVEKQTGLIREYLKQVDVVNYSGHFVLAAHNDRSFLEQKVAQMVKEGLAIDIGRGDRALSLTKGRYAVLINGNATTQGFDVAGRKGYKTFWEKEFIPEFCELVLQGRKEAAFELFATATKALSEGTIDEDDDFLFISVPGRDVHGYSSFARLQERIRHYETIGARKGQLVQQRLDSYNRYKDKWFGPVGPKGRKLSDGPIGDLLLSAFPNINRNPGMLEAVINGRIERLSEAYLATVK